MTQGEELPEGDPVLLCSILDGGQEKIIDLALWLATTTQGGALVSVAPAPPES